MVISKKSRLPLVEDLEIKVNNYVIESVEYQTVLGVIVDKTLSWSLQNYIYLQKFFQKGKHIVAPLSVQYLVQQITLKLLLAFK